MEGTSILDFENHLAENTLPVCPHCGREQTDPWELGLGDEDSTAGSRKPATTSSSA